MELPDKIKNKPTVPNHLVFFWRAFWELSSDRYIGMVEGPIPWSAVDRYALRYGISDIDEFDYFVLVIKAMDGTYMEFRSKKSGKTSMNVGDKTFIKPGAGKEDIQVMGMK